MPLPPDQAWWPRKAEGWGWAWPRRWPGRVVTFAYMIGLVGAGLALAPSHLGSVFLFAGGATVAFIAVCWWKGEDLG